ncbi:MULTISPECIES: DUF4402 domain-containing protein [Pseudoalteromonas]|uniref:DUF4402 domain-containing protein n=1 Tax=Pseudoalteromonas aliena SW19 TaxID=1314866 RepID=A0ABR9E133_9GAMM|nr:MULTISPECIES: DUF4402 domain-containing protein [Pseudoalteromonas]MBE0360304.1 hypothetical protein [Pseudoalteromonas aliena SW19]
MIKPILLLSAFYSVNALSQVTVLEPLSFGTIVVVENTPSSSVTLLPSGTSSGTNIHIMRNGYPAELLFEGFGARVQINITDSGVHQPLTRINGGTAFTLDNIIYANSIVTNAYGMATLKIGGQLSASGDGQLYLDDNYSTTVEITIAY